MIKRFFIFIFCCTSLVFAQTSSSENFLFNKKEYHITKKEEQDPVLLVNALTKNKSSDEEKFAAIYGWIITSIKYNYRQYYAVYGSYALPMSYILKTKQAVCLNYANLLDSLCLLAGITSVTVHGYAKDELFDVGDSLYVDNHAWNAIKIDGLWYLCDITWSTGSEEYRLTSFSRFIYTLYEKHPEKFKEKKIHNVLKEGAKDLCKSTPATTSASYLKQRFSNRMLRRIISFFKLKIKKYYIYKININYYMAQPEVFAIKHCPDNPIWSLGTISTIHGFENDSAYYYFTDSIYAKQQRSGRNCPSCDAYLALSVKNKLRKDEQADSAFNQKNQFAISYKEDGLYKENLLQAYTESNDSIALAYIDSSQINTRNIKRSLQSAKRNVAISISLQKRKSRRKMQLLLTENKQHQIFIRKRVLQSIQETRIYHEIKSKTIAFANKYWKKASAIERTNTSFKTVEPTLSRRRSLYETKLKLEHAEAQLEQIYRDILNKEEQFDSLMENLSLNIWQQAKGLDSLSLFFRKRISLRHMWKDNYKKVVEDVHQRVNHTEFNYKYSLDALIYQPAIKASFLYNTISKLIKAKTKLQRDCLKYQRDLVKYQENSLSEYTGYINVVTNNILQDYCWLRNNLPQITSVYLGFDFLRNQQDKVTSFIIKENAAEKSRNASVNKELVRRYQKYNDMISHNSSLNRVNIKDLRIYKKKLQKRIKASKLKQLKQSK